MAVQNSKYAISPTHSRNRGQRAYWLRNRQAASRSLGCRFACFITRKRHWKTRMPGVSNLGVPDWEVQTWVGSYQAINAGVVARVDPALASILGRPASDLVSYLRPRPTLWQ